MRIINIEGIGPKYKEKLVKYGITSTEKLLEVAASKKGRQSLAGKTDISEKLILEWVNLADLVRIKGIGEEYSDLLEEAGVDTVKELRNRNPENLYQKCIEVNEAKKLVRRTPSLSEVKSWVEQATKLAPVVTY